MYLLIAVINDEDLLDELLTGWLDIGITGATVAETTDLLQLLSHHVPIFAGLRSLTTGGAQHNRTIFTAIDDNDIVDKAIAYLETLLKTTEKSHQGIYFVVPLLRFGRLGKEVNNGQYKDHINKKLGKSIKKRSKK